MTNTISNLPEHAGAGALVLAFVVTGGIAVDKQQNSKVHLFFQK